MHRFTIRDLLWLMVVVAVALAIYFVRPQQVKWEYKIVDKNTADDISAEGDKGWELVHAETGTGGRVYYFKRPKQARQNSN